MNKLEIPVPQNSMLTPPPAGASKNLVSSCGLSTLNRGARGVDNKVDKKVSVFCPSTVGECAFPMILRGPSYHRQVLPAVTTGRYYRQVLLAVSPFSYNRQLELVGRHEAEGGAP